MEIIAGVTGLLAGLIIAWAILRVRIGKELAEAKEKASSLEVEKSVAQEKIAFLDEDRSRTAMQLEEERKLTGNLKTGMAALEADHRNLREKLELQKTELEGLQKKFTTEFENIAQKILRANSAEFTLANQKNIGDILTPLKEKIEKFEKKVEETYEKGLKDQTDLRAELKMLHELNSQISQEASNLTRALKSDTRKMGNWGELILDHILEQSGLVKGIEYETQYTDKNEDGVLIRPDVVVHLPDNKHIIIDSKVSLLAYDSFVNSNLEEDREHHLKAHIDSVKEHVRSLGEKNYPSASRLDTPDFVLLFMPLESAFSLAIQRDTELFNYAWQRRIVIVSPTTLLATLKTVESIWKHEKQTRNALEIARQGSSLYDKFHAFVTDLEKLGTQIRTVQGTYDEAYKKLVAGKGNLVRQAEKLKELGVKTEKSLAGKLLNKENSDEGEG
jgi:DNA recombination protein RmuC